MTCTCGTPYAKNYGEWFVLDDGDIKWLCNECAANWDAEPEQEVDSELAYE